MFLPNLRFLLIPYFDHDAFLHHALYVLDAPVSEPSTSGHHIISSKRMHTLYIAQICVLSVRGYIASAPVIMLLNKPQQPSRLSMITASTIITAWQLVTIKNGPELERASVLQNWIIKTRATYAVCFEQRNTASETIGELAILRTVATLSRGPAVLQAAILALH